MRIPRLIVHEYLQGLGVPGLAGLALLLVTAAWALGGLLPGWQSLQHLSQQTQQATVAIDRIYALAAQEHITLARGEYALGVDPKTHLARYQILLPVRGSYPQLRRFVHALLGQLPAVVVEDLELQRKKIGDTDLNGRIRMTLYLSRS